MRVFVTGATGLLGSHLAALLREGGHAVVALRRPSSAGTYLRELGCELAEGDVRDPPERLAKLMAGCTHVVHAAALVYAGGGWPRTRSVNVEGTRRVLEGAVRAGVGHAVHISSVAVYGTRPGPVDESTPLDVDLPAGDLYARSKREAEGEARCVETEGALPVTVLRPAAVYGERDRLMAPILTRLVTRALTPLLGPGDNTLPVVYAGNVAAAVFRALEEGRGGATYDVGMDFPLTQRELLEGIARGLGCSPRFVSIPGVAVRVGAAVLQRLGVSSPGGGQLALTRVAAIGLGQNPYASRRIRRELGWDPPHRHPEALERTGRWMSRHPFRQHLVEEA